MTPALATIMHHAGRARLAKLAAVTLLAALTEGVGFVLLVPLLALLDAGTPELFGIALPGWLPDLPVLLAIFVALLAIRALAERARAVLAFSAKAALVDGLRSETIGALLEAEYRHAARMRQADNKALLLDTLERAGDALQALFELARAALTLLAALLAAAAIAPLAALVLLGGGLVVLALYRGVRGRSRALGERLGGDYAAVHRRLDDALRALRLVKSAGREDATRSEIDHGFATLRAGQACYVALSADAQIALQVGAAAALALGVWLAVIQVGMEAAVLLSLLAIVARVVPQLGAVQRAWQDWSHAAPTLVQSEDTIQEARDRAETPAPSLPALHLREVLSCESVTVRHRADRAALDGLTARLPAGSITALTGPSGAGKSTLADVLAGLLEPDAGKVSLDGTPLDASGRRAWRGRVGHVHQQAILFPGSVRENLLWAVPGAGDAMLESALEQANAGFVRAWPGGIDADLGDRGESLSGGERQRIALARALLAEPALLILDEATSALDSAAEDAVRDAIAALRGRLTILVIGHRGSLVTLADREIALRDGRLA